MAKRVTVPLDDELHEWVAAKAEDELRTVPNWIAALVKREMDREAQASGLQADVGEDG